MKFGLQSETVEMIKAVFQRHKEIEKVKIFGSRAMGNYRNNSDIDLVVWGKSTEKLMAKLKNELDELPLPYQFDIKSYDEITHLPLRQHIDNYALDFYIKTS